MTNTPAGALFLQLLRPMSTEPEAFFAHAAGVVRDAGLPALRARITLTHAQLLSQPRTLPDDVRARLGALLEATNPAAVIINNALFDDLVTTIAAAAPSARILVAEEGIPLLSLDQIVQFVRTGRRPLTGRGFSEITKEFYEAFYEGRSEPIYTADDLTPHVRQEGIEGDLFLDYICYYRKPYQDAEHAALRDATACTFCNVPQITQRPFAPRFERFVDALRAHLAATPNARVFHVHDAAFSQHADVFAKHVASARELPRGLEFCISQRAPDLLRHRGALERGLELLGASGHRVHFFLIGFESFAEPELSRFNKGYAAPLNVEVVLYLRALRERFGAAIEFARWSSHGFINFTPWTRVADLRANLFYAFALDFTELCRHFYLRKLRLYPSLPLHRMAEADGLLAESFHDRRQEVSHWAAYPREVAWRFVDPQVEAVSRWASRFFLPTREDETTVLRPFVQAMQLGWPSWIDRQVVLYAAIVYAFAAGGCALEDDDERVLATIYSALSLPVRELFAAPADCAGLPEPARPGEPFARSAAEAIATASFRLHVRLVLEGVKPAMLWECPDDVAHAGLIARELEARGLVTATAPVLRKHPIDHVEHETRGHVVFAARQAQTVEALRAAHLAEAERAAGADIASDIGALLGYPPCCSRAFAERAAHGEDTGDDLRVIASTVAAAGDRVLNAAWFDFHPAASIEYTPCSLSCAASSTRMRDGAMPPARPLLLVTRADWLEFDGFAPLHNGFRYTAITRVGDHARVRALEERIRRGDAVVVLRHALFVFRDGAIVDTIAHPEVVPVTFGHRSPFDWLDRVAWRGAPALPPVTFTRAGASGRSDGALTGAIGLSLDLPVASVEPKEPAPTERALRWLAALNAVARVGRPLRSGITIHELSASGDTVTVRLSDGRGSCVVVLEASDPARPAFARTERAMLWYRLEDGAVFTEALSSVFHALLRHAEGN